MSLKDDAIEIRDEIYVKQNTANRIGSLFEKIVSKNGWCSYSDDTRIDLSTAQIIQPFTDTVLINNGGIKQEGQKPYDVPFLYDIVNQKVPGRNGDSLDIMIYLKAVPTAQNQFLNIWLDITGGTKIPANLAELYKQTFAFPRGAAIERGIMYSLPSVYTLDTWEQNGGVVHVETDALLSIYGVVYNFDRTHKAI